MKVDPDIISLFSQHLMATGFAVALVVALSIRRYGYATIFVAALIETYAQARYPFHVRVRDLLIGTVHDAGAKTGLQMKLLLGTAVAGALLLLLLPLRRRMTTPRRVMALGMMLIAGTFGVELISLHATDLILYHPIGPFARCAVVYFVGAMVVAGGALQERRRRT